MNVFLWCIGWLTVMTPTEAKRTNYQVDDKSLITVETRTEGGASPYKHDHRLEARSMAGLISLIPFVPDTASIDLKIRADSLRIIDPELSEKDRRAINVWIRKALGAESHPEIVFHGTAATASLLGDGVFDVDLDGELRIRGQVKNVAVKAQVFVRADALTAQGSVTIHQSDFGVPAVTFDGAGSTVRDDVIVSFDIHAIAKHGN